ncbi:LLM class flavin-dependent oxidoreductase, partial [Acinetobacter baumannii]
DDAFPRNRETGQYVDWDKLHTLNHKGKYFKVQGPLNIERSPQGRPIIFQAGASEVGRSFGARHADAIFSTWYNAADLQANQEFYQDVKNRA